MQVSGKWLAVCRGLRVPDWLLLLFSLIRVLQKPILFSLSLVRTTRHVKHKSNLTIIYALVKAFRTRPGHAVYKSNHRCIAKFACVPSAK